MKKFLLESLLLKIMIVYRLRNDTETLIYECDDDSVCVDQEFLYTVARKENPHSGEYVRPEDIPAPDWVEDELKRWETGVAFNAQGRVLVYNQLRKRLYWMDSAGKKSEAYGRKLKLFDDEMRMRGCTAPVYAEIGCLYSIMIKNREINWKRMWIYPKINSV